MTRSFRGAYAGPALGAFLLAAALATAYVHAEPPPAAAGALVRQDFDDQLPGELPSGWKVLWGEQGDDLFAISNLENGSTGNSALLDRQIGDNPKMYGVGRNLPDIPGGWYGLSFAFRAEGDGSNVSIGIEIRPKSGQSAGRPVSVGINALKASVTGTGSDSELMGRFELRKWYRVSLRLPTVQGKQTTASAVLERRGENGGWVPVSAPVTVTSAPPPGGYGVLMISTWPNKRNYRVFIDDLVVEPAADPKL